MVRMVRKVFALILFGFATFYNHAATPTNKFDSFVMFGDSLTDNGNLYAYMWGYLPISPPYFDGHFSNGPVWAEYLYRDWYGEQNAGGFQDYAVGGACAVLSRKGSLPFSLAIEINDYLYWHTYDKPDSSLFAIWIGANNYLNGPENVGSITTSVINAIDSAIEKLVKNGGNKFIVINLPDLSVTPFAQKYGDISLLKKLSQIHNQKLAEKANEWKEKYPSITLIFFDLQALFKEVIDEPAKHSIINSTDPCYLGTYSGWYRAVKTNLDLIYSELKKRSNDFDDRHWTMIKNNQQLLIAAQFAQIFNTHPIKALEDPLTCYGYLFWDHIHPTTDVHRAIANEVKKLVKQAGLEAVMPESSDISNNRYEKYSSYL